MIDLELDDLLAEANAEADRKKASRRNIKREVHSNDLIPLDEYVPLDAWETKYYISFYTKMVCACGHTSFIFSHHAARQVFRSKSAGNPKRWTKIQPHEVEDFIPWRQPCYREVQVPQCACCQDLSNIRPFAEVSRPERQLSIFSLLEN